jgi:phenylalanyl-tRNA synthetase beta subunit
LSSEKCLAPNLESEKSIIKTEYSDSQIKAFLTKANMAVFSKGSGVSAPPVRDDKSLWL